MAFTMKRYVQSDLEADRQVATTLAELIVGRSLASVDITGETANGDPARRREPGPRQRIR